MRPAQVIKIIRQSIPVFQCIPGCHDCCHDLITWTKWEWDQIRDKRIQISLTCPYLGECGCEIYRDRPVVCRIFGALRNPAMKCKHDCKPDNPLSRKEETELLILYGKLTGNDHLDDLARTVDLVKIIPLVEAGAECTAAVWRIVQRMKEKIKCEPPEGKANQIIPQSMICSNEPSLLSDCQQLSGNTISTLARSGKGAEE